MTRASDRPRVPVSDEMLALWESIRDAHVHNSELVAALLMFENGRGADCFDNCVNRGLRGHSARCLAARAALAKVAP